MLHTLRPRFSLVACLLTACSGSGDGSTDATNDMDGFITEEEAADQKSDDNDDRNASNQDDSSSDDGDDGDVDVRLPDAASGLNGSGVVVAEEEGDAWLIPDDGASFTGPPLQAGEGPTSSDSCPDQETIVTATEAVGESICFFSEEDPETPAARIDQVIESAEGEDFVRIRLTLNPNFVDNSYGENAIGWGGDEAAPEEMPPKEMPEEMAPKEMPEEMAPEEMPDAMAPKMPEEMAPEEMAPKMPDEGMKEKPKKAKTHTFKDLVGSDHAEIKLTDGDDEVVMHFRVDYLSEDADAASGYSSLGVTGGEGKMIVGEAEWVLAATTSMDRNLNACGYSSFTEDSPVPPTADDEGEAENWDYRVVYEVWISLEAFGDAGFGEAYIDWVHASPSKGADNTVVVTSGPCPPDDDDPPQGGGGAPNGGGGAPPTAGSGGSGAGGSRPADIDEAR